MSRRFRERMLFNAAVVAAGLVLYGAYLLALRFIEISKWLLTSVM